MATAGGRHSVASRIKGQAALEAGADLETTRDALADCVEEAERAMTLLNTRMDIAETESGLVEFQADRGTTASITLPAPGLGTQYSRTEQDLPTKTP